MIVKIQRKEENAMHYIAHLCDLSMKVYTIENNDKLIQIELLDENGYELAPERVFHICRSFETKLACEAFARK
jgi:hypothetical protein